MANAQRGEVELTAGSARYTFALTFNAICTLQGRTKKTWLETLIAIRALDFQTLREAVFEGLQRHHKSEFKTLDRVGDFIANELDGGIPAAIAAVGQAIELNSEKAEDGNPQTPTPAGTGTSR